MKILVVGGTGAVGSHICREVVRTLGPQTLVVGDYNLERGREFARNISESCEVAELDVSDRRSVERATEGADAVIIAVRQVEPVVQTVCTERGIHSVDIVPDTPLARSILSPERGDVGRPGNDRRSGIDGLPDRDGQRLCGVVAAGLIPGLSGLMARRVIEKSLATGGDSTAESRPPGGGPTGPVVHVSLLQRKNGTAGAAGIADMLGLFTRPVQHDGHSVRGFTAKRTTPFPRPFGHRPVRLVAFPEAGNVRDHFGVDRVHYWTAFDNEPFNKTIGTLNRLGVLNRFCTPGGGLRLASLLARGKQTPDDRDETVALVAQAGDFAVSLTVPSDYGGTAMAVVAMTRALLSRGTPDYGVTVPFQLFTLEQILGLVDSPEIRVEETESDDRPRR
jgi:hypothetical protein